MSSAQLDPRIRAVVRCPYCLSELHWNASHCGCIRCSHKYPWTDSGSLDLRLKAPKQVMIPVTLANGMDKLERFDALTALRRRKEAEIQFSSSDIQKHIGPELMSHFSAAADRDQLALDLGCGTTIHRKLLEKCGYTYVGIDYNRPGAPILADAHALPFADNSFSFAISIAVLEHLAHPILALRELFRVMKPESRFVGSVAFMEPFHGNSFYHHTHRGLAHGLLAAGFEIEELGYNKSWIAPFSLRKKFFPKLPRLGKALLWPGFALSLLYWKAGSWRTSNPRLLSLLHRDIAGSFGFAAIRKAEIQ